MFFWLFEVIIWIALSVTAYYLTRPKKPDSPVAGALSDFNLPTVDEGTAIPVLRGTGLLRAPIIGWDGNFRTMEFKDHDVVLGYHYFFGMDLFFCHGPVDELLEIRFDDKYSVGRGDTVIPPGCILRVEDGGGVHDITLIPGTYFGAWNLAKAVTSQVTAAVPTFGRVVYQWCLPQTTVYGIKIPTFVTLGFSAVIGGTTHSCTAIVLTGNWSDGVSIAIALNKAIGLAKYLGGAHSLNLQFGYDIISEKFSFNVSGVGVSNFWIHPDSTILPYLGIQHGAGDVHPTTSFPASYDAEHLSARGYFYLDINPGITIHWPESSASAREVLGWTDPSDQTEQGRCQTPRTSLLSPYTFTKHWGLPGYPVDEGDRWTFGIDLPDLYGGTKGGGAGGVWGSFRLYKGTDGQRVDEYVAAYQSAPHSAYPGICHMSVDACWGIQTVFRTIAAVLRCTPNPLELAVGGRVGDDYNPGNMLWEICTDKVWGAALPEDLLDKDAFRTLGLQCAVEGLGGTWIFEVGRPAIELAEDVCRQINAMPVVQPLTGKLGFKLIRGDYDLGTIPEVDESQLSNIKFSRPSWGKTKTSVLARFINRAKGYVDDSRIVHNEAAISAQDGRIDVEEINCPGLTTGPAASKAAWAQLAPASYPFAVLEADCDRTLWRSLPGEVFAFTSARLGITKMAMRVCTLNTGNLENGKLSLQAAEDVFGLNMQDGDEPSDIPEVLPVAFAICWPEENGSDPLVQAIGPHGERLFDGLGVLVFGDTLRGKDWDRDFQIAGYARRWMCPDGDGGFYFICRDDSGADGRIYAQRMTKNGDRLWGDGVQVCGDTPADFLYCGVCLGDNGLMVVWNEWNSSTPTTLRAQRISKDGVKQLEPNGVIFYIESAGARLQDAVVNGDDDGIFVTIMSGTTGMPASIEIGADGVFIGGPLQLFTSNDPGMVYTEPDGGKGTGSITMENSDCTSRTRFQRANRANTNSWGTNGVQLGTEDTETCGSIPILGLYILSDNEFGVWVLAHECRNAQRSGGGMVMAMHIDPMGTSWIKSDLGMGFMDAGGIALNPSGGAFFCYTDKDGQGLVADPNWCWGHVHSVQAGGVVEWSSKVDEPEDGGLEEGWPPDLWGADWLCIPITVKGGGVVVVWNRQREGTDPLWAQTYAQRWDSRGEKMWGDHGIDVFPGLTSFCMLAISPTNWQVPGRATPFLIATAE